MRNLCSIRYSTSLTNSNCFGYDIARNLAKYFNKSRAYTALQITCNFTFTSITFTLYTTQSLNWQHSVIIMFFFLFFFVCLLCNSQPMISSGDSLPSTINNYGLSRWSVILSQGQTLPLPERWKLCPDWQRCLSV